MAPPATAAGSTRAAPPRKAPEDLPKALRQAWARARRDRAFRKKLALASPAFFAAFYLRGENDSAVAVPHCHVRWYREIGNGDSFRTRHRETGEYQQRRTLLLAPRDHGKTFVSAYVTVLHRIVKNPNIRILLLGPNADSAEERLSRIRRELEENEALRRDFALPGGEGFRDADRSWTNRQLYCRRTDRTLAGPTVRAIGAGGKITGGRADLIIADDPEDEDSVYTANTRTRRLKWWRGTIQELLEPWGEVVLIGTRKHHDDLYAHVLAVTDKAILEWPEEDDREWVLNERGDVVGCKVRGAAKVLWPEKWSIGQLLVKRESMTSTLFARENQNEVQDDGSSTFKWDWLEAAYLRGAPRRAQPEAGIDGWPGLPAWHTAADIPEGWWVVQAWDPAFTTDKKKAERGDRDYFVGWTIAFNPTTGERRIIDGFRKRGLSPGEFEREMKMRAARYTTPTPHHPLGPLLAVGVENNSLGMMYQLNLVRDTDLPIHGHATDQAKADPFQGVPAMAHLFEHNKISFATAGADEHYAGAIKALMDELHGLGLERHDDTVMALWIAECLIRRLRAVFEQGDPRDVVREDVDRADVPRSWDEQVPTSTAERVDGTEGFEKAREAPVARPPADDDDDGGYRPPGWRRRR